MRIALRNHAEVAHTWAHQLQPEGRASRVFFEGDAIYSYGRHFCIAKHVQNESGDRAVLFNAASYSISTSKHQSIVLGAIPESVPVFRVPHLDTFGWHDANRQHYERLAESQFVSAARARSHAEWKFDQACRTVDEANRYAEFFGLDWRIDRPETLDPEWLENIRRKAAEHVAAEAKKTRERMAESAARWRAGETHALWGYPDIMLRVNGDTVETSRGATVPAKHAKLAWRVIKRCKETGTEFNPNGHSVHLGNFQADRIEPNGTLHAGCHVIKYAELEHCATLLGCN